MAQQLDMFSQIEQELKVEHEKVMATVPIADKLYRSITEVAKILSVNASHLRFWEKEFTQIKLRKNGKGDRLYTKEDIELMHTIYYLTKIKKFTLEGTREYLKKDKKSAGKEAEIIASLKNVRAFLVNLKNQIINE